MGAYRGLVLAVIAGVAMTAGEPPVAADGSSDAFRTATAWDWLPVAGYEREALEFALRPRSPATRWSADAEPAMPLTVASDDAVLRVAIPATATPQRIQLSDHGAERIGIAFVRPGAGAGLTLDSGGHLRHDQDWAVLVLPRVEAIADRRWAMLLPSREAHPEPCAIELAAPPTLGDDQPPLAAMIAESQTRAVHGQAVLIHLAAADRLAGWSQRTWRQSLAWLAADLAARGARRVVLVEPCGPGVIDSQLAPLRRLARDVAAAYRLTTVETAALRDDRFWLASPGVLALRLNADGNTALDRLLAPWRR